MDFMKNILQAIKVFFGNLTTNQKLSLVMVTASLVVAFVILMSLSASESYASLGVTVEPQAISRTRQALAQAGIPAKFLNGQVQVPRGRLEEALSVVALSAGGEGGVSFSFEDLVKQEGLSMRTSEERRTMLKVALQNALRTWVEKFPGVRRASVVMDIPRERLRVHSKDMGSASVSFQTRQGLELSDREYLSIARMVAGAHRLVTVERVTITNTSTGHGWRAPKKGDLSAVASERLKAQKATADLYREKISSLLSKLGSDNYEVRVFAEIDWQTQTIDEKVADEKTSLMGKDEEKEDTRDVRPAGATGVTPNTSAGIPGAATGGSRSMTKSKKKTVLLYPSVKTTHTVKGPGELQKATVSVIVNSLRIREIAAEIPGVKDDEGKIDEAKLATESAQILDSYQSLINFPGLKKEDVSFKAIPFTRPVIVAGVSGPWVKDFLTQHIRVFGMLLLGLVAILFVTMQARKAMPEPKMPEIPEYREVEQAIEDALKGEPDEESARDERMSQRIQEFVEENPYASASLVKRWINRDL